jgi:CRP-like cAMP-binding protein
VPGATQNVVPKKKKNAKGKVKREKYLPIQACAIMHKIQFFRGFDEVMPGLIDTLSKVAKTQQAKKGDIIFRKGDPAVDCYVILAGEVGVYINRKEQTSPREILQAPKANNFFGAVENSGADGKHKSCFDAFWDSLFSDIPDEELVEQMIQQKRHETTEGHNTWSAVTDLGKCVVTLQAEDVFGELGLLENHPRAAAIKCSTKCTFMVIQKSDFLHMFGGRLDKTKITLFVEKVPGFRTWANNNLVESEVCADGKRTINVKGHPSDVFF